MLIRFNAANFLSFNEETEFNMLAAKSLKTHTGHVYRIKKDLKVLKASAIYGANGAGKSNLIKAIASLQEIVNEGKVPVNAVSKKSRTKSENRNKPIFHEIEFSFKKKVYTYGITFDSNLVLEEWLYETGGSEPKLIFARSYSKEKKRSKIKVADKYIKTEKAKMLISLMEENLLLQNELLISKNENLKIKEIDTLLEWVDGYLKIVFPESKAQLFIGHLDKEGYLKKFSEDLIKSFDVGITSLDLRSEDFDVFFKRNDYFGDEVLEKFKLGLDEGDEYEIQLPDRAVVVIKENDQYLAKTLITTHSIGDKQVPFEIDEESDGTQRLIDFIPLFGELSNNESTYIIDEIDRSLHPAMIHAIVKKIMNDDSIKGQLVFTTHESSLLDCKLFRTDEIWFAEKDRTDQSTQLYTLNEFKPRNDLDIEKGYLNGRFGAIPFLSKLDDLSWEDD